MSFIDKIKSFFANLGPTEDVDGEEVLDQSMFQIEEAEKRIEEQ